MQNNNSAIIFSYATGNADGGTGNADHVGGLVGNQNGEIISSYLQGLGSAKAEFMLMSLAHNMGKLMG